LKFFGFYNYSSVFAFILRFAFFGLPSALSTHIKTGVLSMAWNLDGWFGTMQFVEIQMNGSGIFFPG
jgi:hypothetical protein